MRRSPILLSALLWVATAQAQVPVVQAVVNSASFAPGVAVAPGSIISIFGQRLAEGEYSATVIPLPTKLGGTSVEINGLAAPLFYVSPGQINAQLPFEVQADPAVVVVRVGSTSSASLSFPIAATGPGIFLWGGNRGVVQNQDLELNTPIRAARPDEVVTAYLTGQGKLDWPVVTGTAAASDPLSRPTAKAWAFIGGRDAELTFLGLTPGLVGLLQANLRIPKVPTGEHTVSIHIGSATSNPALISVHSDSGAFMEFVPIPAGEFMMGCSPGDDCTDWEKPAHPVWITKPFEIAKYEVTQGQWEAVMGNNPSYQKGTALSVDSVSWDDAQVFISRLNETNDGYHYRLPTEAEWEYAARAGTTGPYPNPVNQQLPNAWGLYDVIENKAEWCADWYDRYYYQPGLAIDPLGPSRPDDGLYRVVRGQGDGGPTTRVSYRNGQKPDYRMWIYGFRCVRERVP